MRPGARAGGGGGGAGVIVLLLLGLGGAAVFAGLVGVHEIKEGHVGIYWIGGRQLEDVTEPGFHFMYPFVTTVENVQVTLQTDTVTNIPCGTSGGVMIYFDKVEVVNRLARKHVAETVKLYGVDYDKTWIFDKIHHEINQFCSSHSLQEVYIDQFESLDEALAQKLQADCDKWNTGIEIIAIRVTKPRIPDNVKRNFESVEEKKTALLVATETQRVTRLEEETAQMRAQIQAKKEAEVARIQAQKEAEVSLIEAQRHANVSKIKMEQQIKEAEAQKTMQDIQNDMALKRAKSIADGEAYRVMREAEAQRAKLSPEYLQLQLYMALANNTKIFFGESIPKIFLDWQGTAEKMFGARTGGSVAASATLGQGGN